MAANSYYCAELTQSNKLVNVHVMPTVLCLLICQVRGHYKNFRQGL